MRGSFDLDQNALRPRYTGSELGAKFSTQTRNRIEKQRAQAHAFPMSELGIKDSIGFFHVGFQAH